MLLVTRYRDSAPVSLQEVKGCHSQERGLLRDGGFKKSHEGETSSNNMGLVPWGGGGVITRRDYSRV
jgi:hypothetical protein